ncbi:MAG: zinc ribbon domain-containing protein, partial [Ktedonobacteraceae bacterium]|nr:zinc ribbon domain-containing protein [Ktedonobacteraceae bacterium]
MSILDLSILLAPTPTAAATTAATSTPSSGQNGLMNALTGLVAPTIGCMVAFFVIFWLSLVIWTFRDIRARTQDFLSQVLATVLVTIFPVGGLFIYMILRPRQTLAEIYERQLEEESLLAEMTERQTCSNCHARIETDFQVCPSCGNSLKRPCPKCERLLELRWTFCPYCASNVNSAPAGMPGMPGVPSMQGIPGTGGLPMGGPVA